MRSALLLAVITALGGCGTDIVISADGRVIGECEDSWVMAERWAHCLHHFCSGGVMVDVNPMGVPDDVRCIAVDSGIQ
jgi:hypothetical protein